MSNMEYIGRMLLIVLLFVFLPRLLWGQETKIKLALLKDKRRGDWHTNPTSLLNLISYCNKHLGIKLAKNPVNVEPGSRDIFNYPYVYMTGHGNVAFTPVEAQNLREYLLAGGFLHVDANYGLSTSFRQEIKKVFPEEELVELPWEHPIFHQKSKFPQGLPKIHEHDAKHPQVFGMIKEGRLMVLFTFETDLGDGWEDREVHDHSEHKREQALQMGANIISYVFRN